MKRGEGIFFVSIVFLVLSMPLFSENRDSLNVIIPKPQKMILGKGTFLFNAKTHYFSNTNLSKDAINYLQLHLKKNAGYSLARGERAGQMISFLYDRNRVVKPEGYILHIQKKKIVISARDKAGFFYAVVSLMQLMDPAIWRVSGGKRKMWSVPVGIIDDYPRYHWRGMMLDCSRNFFSMAYVKKFIDRMAQHKLNRFHWHLTDDEGWRIEIKKYPLLTKTGGKRGPGTRLPFSTFPTIRGSKNRVQSGYYTQAQIKQIVAYAKARSVEIIPEIDIPGHAKAAIMAYPKLLEDPKDKSRYHSVQKISNNTINPGMESTYRFLENVLAEVSRLFPFPYIHLGGDEVPKGAWKHSPMVQKLMRKKTLSHKRVVEDYFFVRMDKILQKHHKKMIAWQEVASQSRALRSSNIYMAWKSKQSGRKLLKKGKNVIQSPVHYLYFDQQYVRSKKEPGHTWSSPVSTEKTYTFDPGYNSRLYGVEACLWSETLLNEKIADYLAWPRTFALSEVAWTLPEQKNWKTFKERVLRNGFKRLKAQEIDYRNGF